MNRPASSYPVINVSAGIILRHGQILAMQRPEGKPFAGYWEFPGGKVEGDETPGQTLCRELAEELGINVTRFGPFETVRHCYNQAEFIAQIHFFIIEAFTGEPVSLENANLRWIALQKALEMDFLPPDQRILHDLHKSSFDSAS